MTDTSNEPLAYEPWEAAEEIDDEERQAAAEQHPKTVPQPFSDDEWGSIAPRLTGHPDTVSVACTGLLLARLAVTVDALTAQRDAARGDRVCWRETHNQVAAERDALRSVVDTFTDWIDTDTLTLLGSRWTSAEADAIRRALDASPTEPEPVDQRCTGTLGSRPSWMNPDQYDAAGGPCRCDLTAGHDGPHECEHTRADASPTEGNPE